MKSSLLFDKYPILVNPSLAAIIGLNEAIVLQQVHYWVKRNEGVLKNYEQGKYWTYNSYQEWLWQLPFWSVSTIKRIIKRLEKLGLLISGNFNRYRFDRTKWYTIDYKAVDALNVEVWISPNGEKIPYALFQSDLIQLTDMTKRNGQNDLTNTRDLSRDIIPETKQNKNQKKTISMLKIR